VRLNRLNIFKNWNLYSLNAEAQWYDDVIKRRQDDRNTTLQRLPFISFDSLRQPLMTPTLLYDFESEYTYFFREDSYTGHRIDIHPRVYLPLRYKNYFSIEPSVGFRETLWYLDDREDFSDENKKSFSRELVDAQLDLSTDLSRSYSLNSKTADRIKHTIRPQVIYNFIPPTSQDNLPEFDEVDRVEKTSAVTYSITNTFSLRSRLPEENMKQPVKADANEDMEIVDSEPVYAYRPFCRSRWSKVMILTRPSKANPSHRFMPELDLRAGSLLSLYADAEWSTYESRFLTHNIALTAADKRGDRIFLEHRFAKGLRETFYGNAIINLHERIAMFAEYERNIKDGNTLLYGVGFLYMASCWSLDIGYTDEEGDKKYALMVNLYGLGGVGIILRRPQDRKPLFLSLNHFHPGRIFKFLI
jgi:LPS-assembly protein